MKKQESFYDYFKHWIETYKKGAVREVTYKKYLLSLSWIKKLIPNLKVSDINRTTYQDLLNEYAKYHEKTTTMDFHHQIKGAIVDAVDEGLIQTDPTRKAIIKGRSPVRDKKPKYLNQYQVHSLLADLDLGETINTDWLILLIAKTGIRFSEALGITKSDFDFTTHTLSINKTWDYKTLSGFTPTKNESSIRKIQLDWQTSTQFAGLIKDLDDNTPIFVNERVYNSTINERLKKHCQNVGVPVITIHGLRHTHASLMLYSGVSIASVARRLGHASMTTTQKTYLHIIQELENKDLDQVMRMLSGLI